jgi:hypothetical protein
LWPVTELGARSIQVGGDTVVAEILKFSVVFIPDSQ